jgi:flagellar basal body-associated protein FliL
MNKTKAILISVIAVIVLSVAGLVAVTVWPTRYRYDRYTYQKHPRAKVQTVIVRIDRFTGEVHYLGDSGWRLSQPE